MEIELEFQKVGRVYEAKTAVNNTFNLHVESAEKSHLLLLWTTVENGVEAKKDDVDFGGELGSYDDDHVAKVFPKYVRVTSTKMPTRGVIKINE